MTNLRFRLGLLLGAWCGGCGGSGGQVSSESHWVMCSLDVDCLELPDAQGCNGDGLCVDALAEPIELAGTQSDVATARERPTPECDPLSAPARAPIELGTLLATGKDSAGTSWALDYVPNPDGPTCSPPIQYLCTPTETRAFRSDDDRLVRMRVRQDLLTTLESADPEVEGDYSEVLQLSLSDDPPPAPPQGPTMAYGVVALATEDGEIVLGSYDADPVTKPEQPISDPSQMNEQFTPVDDAALRGLPIVDFIPRSRINFHATFDDATGRRLVILVTTDEENWEGHRLFFGTKDALVQRRIENYSVAGDGGTTRTRFWADGKLVEAFLPQPVNPLSLEVGEPTITLDGNEQPMEWLDESEALVDTYEANCFSE